MSTPAYINPSTAGEVRPSVLVVDDSAVVRGLIARWIEADNRLSLAGTCSDGQIGVRKAGEVQPDLVVLDVEMPNMDGLTALPLILKASPNSRVIMASTLTLKGGQVTLKALALGAADYAPKPEAGRVAGADAFRQELLGKLIALSPQRRSTPPVSSSAPATVAPAPVKRVSLPIKPDLVVIGSSTGGPQALRDVCKDLAQDGSAPIVVAQHMPKLFTAILAEHLSKTGIQAKEAEEGEIFWPGKVYLAPGDFHLTVTKAKGMFVGQLDQGPPINYCRPAVDPLFESAARVAGQSLIGVVLTGMGSDGREGARAIKTAGGAIIAQDEATSVVWGMPGAVSQAGLADLVLPLNEIGKTLSKSLTGRG